MENNSFSFKKYSTKISNFFKKIKAISLQILLFLKKYLDLFNNTFPNTSQNIQLTFIYGFALIDLIHSIAINLFYLGPIDLVLGDLTRPIKAILMNPYLQFITSPEKVFFLSYVAIEVIIVNKELGFSKLVKYHVLLIFSLLMVQGLMISIWDTLLHRQVTSWAAKAVLYEGMAGTLNKSFAFFLFMTTFLYFIYLYSTLYLQGIGGKYGRIGHLKWITDSVAFWLKVKTPGMDVGKRKKKK